MARSGQVRAGRAYVEVGADDKPLQERLKAAEARVKAFGASIAGIGARLAGVGAALGAPLLTATKLFADAGSELNDMSARTGLSVEALSQLQYAAQQTGTDLGAVEAAARKMQKAVVAAANGSVEAEAALAALGLSASELLKLSPDRQFQVIAKAIAAIPNPAARAAAAMELFGKSGTAILPLAADFDALTGKARELGLVMSGAEAAAADDLGDALDTLGAVAKRAVVTIGGALAPAITDVARWIGQASRSTLDWIQENQELIRVAGMVAAGAVAGGAAMVALGGAVSGVGAVVGTAAAGITAIGGALAAVLSPLGLVTAGLAGLAGWFVTSTDAGRGMARALGDAFNGLRETATAAWKGIADALAAGDLALAGKVAWTGLKVEFTKGINFLRSAWSEFTGWFQDIFAAAVRGLAGVIVDLGAKVQDLLTRADPRNWGDLDAKLARVEADRRVAQQALDDQFQAGVGDRMQERADQLAALQKDLEAARAEFDAARRAAAAAGGGADFGDVGKLPKKPGTPGVDLPDLDAALADARRKVDVSGSFSAAALRGLGVGSSIQDEQLDALKRLEKSNDRIAERLRTARVLMED